MSGQTLLIILLVGLIAGWLAGQIVQGTGFGLIADIGIGIVGALIGAWLLPHLHIHLEGQAENSYDHRARQGHTSFHRSAPPEFSGFFL